MIKNSFLFLSLGFIFYFALDHSLLKSQIIDCQNGIQLACDLLTKKTN